MQDDPWSVFPSFDELLWSEQAEGIPENAMNALGLDLKLRGEKRGDWPVLPAKSLGHEGIMNAWELQQRVDGNSDLIQALNHGVEGIRVVEPNALRPLLDGVHLDMIALHLESSFEPAFIQDLKSFGAGIRLKGSWLTPLHNDEEGTLAQVEHMKQVESEFPELRSWSCPSSRWLLEGSSPADVLARIGRSLDVLLSSYSTKKEKASALGRVELKWRIGENVLFEIACLRSLRFFWKRWLAYHEIPEMAVWIGAENAPYAANPVKVEDHLIPLTAGVYAAVIGGADGITALPHDMHDFGQIGSKGGLRWARNVHHIMREESGLHLVADPMGGSSVIESWTHSILDLAWKNYLSPVSGAVDNKF